MKKYLFIAAVSMMAAACTVAELDEAGTPGNNGPVFTASFDEDGTKVYVDGDLQTKWTEDDRISIFTTTYNDQYKFDGNTGDDNGTFSKVVNSFNTGNDVPTNYAVYPYNSGTTITTSGTISLNLPATQSYAENSYGLGANTMVAATQSSSSYSLRFKSLCGFLVVKLYGTGTVQTITLTGNNGEKIAGAATVSPVYGEAPSVSMSDSGTETITLDCGDGVALGATAETATSFWFAIPPTTFSKGFTLTATNTEGWSMTKTTSSSKTISRNVKQGMAALQAVFDTKAGFVYFEDANFKAYCVTNFDKDKDGEISTAEAEVVKSIYCSSKSISSLRGVEKFTTLTSLQCGFNQITTLDVSRNTKLTKLTCSADQLTALDVTKNTALTELWCYSNQLTVLDVSNNTALTKLDCGSNKLTTLDVSKNSALTTLYCGSNQLTTLDVSNNTALKTLWCQSNQLTTLDVSKNTALTDLLCGSNQLTVLDVSNNTALTRLSCGSNQLTSLDVSKNTAMKTLRCSSNKLTALDVTKNTALTSLSCDSNKLTVLDVSNNTALTELWCYSNQLTSLDVSKNTELTNLDCHFNQLTTLDVSNNTAMKALRCSSNKLTALDVTKNTALTTLECGSNQLTVLDVSNNTVLKELYCIANQLTTLDVSNNTSLKNLNCCGNPNLKEIWLLKDQTIATFSYNSSISTIKYKGLYESVDLGLSVKWATCNIGANNPEEYGKYFAWGDVVGQTWNGSSWSGGGFSTLFPAYEVDDNENLMPEYDAAHVNWGDPWRMPTEAEQQELIDNCTSTWTDNYNGTGVAGRIFTSNKTGYTDKSIFMPAAGYGYDICYLDDAGSDGNYWSGTFSIGPNSWYLEFGSDDVYTNRGGCNIGLSVRPVCE